MLNLKLAINEAVEYAKKIATEHLGANYEVTVVFHTDEGDPEDAVVASTGDKVNAIPSLTAAATESEDMEKV